jgi:hypothetical protein
MSAQQEMDLESSSLLLNAPCSGVQAGTDCRPSCCCTALSDSESARLGCGAARPQFTCILDHDLFGCSCELELNVEPPASTGGRQMGLERNPDAPGQVGLKQTWTELETQI